MSETYYPAVFHKAEDIGGYWVEYPDLPGCLSLGGSEKEALEMAKEALSLYLERDCDLFEIEI